MGSNFGSVPYNNVANGNLSEFHFSQQNSRIGFRIDGDWKGTHFIGYNEFDFNGTSGSTSLAVSNGAIVPRLRLYWVDVRKGKVEFLAGQSWSMLTPNRNGLSALPGDLFYTQVIDINYMAGLTWTRQPGMRVLYSPQQEGDFRLLRRTTRSVHRRFGGRLRHYAAYHSFGTRLERNSTPRRTSARASYLAQPTYTPDFIAKVAFDLPALPLRSRRHREQLQDRQYSYRAVRHAPHHPGRRTSGRLQCRSHEELPSHLDQLL